MNSPVDIYQPLKAQPGNTKPPQSKAILETADGKKRSEKIFFFRNSVNKRMKINKLSSGRKEEICNYSPGTAYHFKFISANHLNLEGGKKC